jgi:hypothetical protein
MKAKRNSTESVPTCVDPERGDGGGESAFFGLNASIPYRRVGVHLSRIERLMRGTNHMISLAQRDLTQDEREC